MNEAYGRILSTIATAGKMFAKDTAVATRVAGKSLAAYAPVGIGAGVGAAGGMAFGDSDTSLMSRGFKGAAVGALAGGAFGVGRVGAGVWRDAYAGNGMMWGAMANDVASVRAAGWGGAGRDMWGAAKGTYGRGMRWASNRFRSASATA